MKYENGRKYRSNEKIMYFYLLTNLTSINPCECYADIKKIYSNQEKIFNNFDGSTEKFKQILATERMVQQWERKNRKRISELNVSQ